MKYLTIVICVLTIQTLSAQPASLEALEGQDVKLSERFQLMKAKSGNYNDYKVIKERVLDGVWKYAMDTLQATKVRLRETRGTIAGLETELRNAQAAFQQKETAMADITYAGTHINVLGIEFNKKTFVILMSIILLGLLALVGVMTGRQKIMYSAVKEKMDLVNATLHEFEEYKRKALDRQTKLSRELQNERNKLMESRRG